MTTTEISELDIKTDVSEFIKFSLQELLQKEHKVTKNPVVYLPECANYLKETMTNAMQAEIKIIENMKKVNRWSKRNKGYHEFTKPERPVHKGWLSFIYFQPLNGFYFFYDKIIMVSVVEYMLITGMLVYYGEIMHQGTKHKAWTVPENVPLINSMIKYS